MLHVALYIVGLTAWGTLVRGRWRTWVLAALNAVFYFGTMVLGNSAAVALAVATYLGLGYFLALRLVAPTKWRTAGLFYPLAGIIGFLYLMPRLTGMPVTPDPGSVDHTTLLCFGISYVSFRMLLFAADLSELSRRDLGAYLAYVIYLPSCFVGPLTEPARFLESLGTKRQLPTLGWDTSERLLLGVVKFAVLSAYVDRLTYQSILLDGNTHSALALFVAVPAFYLYLYLNFSGACDIVIALSKTFGIHCDENFNHPFRSRSIAEFWQRWHMTLSRILMRFVFTPVSIVLLRRLGTRRMTLALSCSFFCTFLLVAAWHGVGWRWLSFGALQGIALSVWNTWQSTRRNSPGRWPDRVSALRFYPPLAWLLTHSFIALSLMLFANDFTMLQRIFSVIR